MMEGVSCHVARIRILAISQPRAGPPASPASVVRLLPVNLMRSVSLWKHHGKMKRSEGDKKSLHNVGSVSPRYWS